MAPLKLRLKHKRASTIISQSNEDEKNLSSPSGATPFALRTTPASGSPLMDEILPKMEKATRLPRNKTCRRKIFFFLFLKYSLARARTGWARSIRKLRHCPLGVNSALLSMNISNIKNQFMETPGIDPEAAGL